MKWLLNQQLYDSTKATLIASWSNGLSYKDPSFEEENLYKTNAGAFFLVGNRLSVAGQSASIDDKCLPLTKQRSLEWCQKRHQPEAAAEHLTEILIIA